MIDGHIFFNFLGGCDKMGFAGDLFISGSDLQREVTQCNI